MRNRLFGPIAVVGEIGKAVPGKSGASAGSLPFSRFGLIGVILNTGITTSAVPLLSLSILNSIADTTVLPGRSSATPWQTVVISLGTKPLPVTKISTGPNALMRLFG